jgi:hypothetical protein
VCRWFNSAPGHHLSQDQINYLDEEAASEQPLPCRIPFATNFNDPAGLQLPTEIPCNRVCDMASYYPCLPWLLTGIVIVGIRPALPEWASVAG